MSSSDENENINDIITKESNEQTELSALHANIKTKGKNSYYYAHKKRQDVEIHEWDGNEAPRLLQAQSIERQDTEPTESITTYAWSDGKKKVTIYIPLPDIGTHDESNTNMEWTGDTIQLTIKQYQGKTRLLRMKLYDTISDVSIKRKSDKLVLVLTKSSEFTWHQLKKDTN